MAKETPEEVVAFDRNAYEGLSSIVLAVAQATQDAMWSQEGYSIGPDTRAQPAKASWEIVSQVGNSYTKLATQVRTYTDTLCEKSMPDFSDSVLKAADVLEEADNTATDNSKS